MKAKHYLPLLFFSLIFNSCIEKTITRKVHNTVPPEYSINREDLMGKISEIIPSEEINITSGNIKNSGEEEYNFLSVEISGPDSFPASGFSFSDLADEIMDVVKGEIKNINDYKKLQIEVRNTVEENDTEHTRTFRKEIDL